MKHAGAIALNTISHLLAALRRYSCLKERRAGVFYLKSAAFVHFHEDAQGMFADVRLVAGWQRMPVTTKTQARYFLREIEKTLGAYP
jgi:hypothetical protein